MRALALLQRDGIIQRSTPVAEIEDMVKAIGTDVERRLGEGEDVDTRVVHV